MDIERLRLIRNRIAGTMESLPTGEAIPSIDALTMWQALDAILGETRPMPAVEEAAKRLERTSAWLGLAPWLLTNDDEEP